MKRMWKQLISFLITFVMLIGSGAIAPSYTPVFAEGEEDSEEIIIEEESPPAPEEVVETEPEPVIEPVIQEVPAEEPPVVEEAAEPEPEEVIPAEEEEEEIIPEEPAAEEIAELPVKEEAGEKIEEKPVVPEAEEPAVASVPEHVDEPKPIAYPSGQFTGTAGDIHVTVTYGEGIFPEGTEMVVIPITRAYAIEIAESAIRDDKEVSEAVGVDISFYYDNQEIEPKDGQNVQVNLALGRSLKGEEFQTVHKDDSGKIKTVDENASSRKSSFESDSFSIYVIVGANDPVIGTYKFYDGFNKLLSTQAVKNGETVYAPESCEKDGFILKGWALKGSSDVTVSVGQTWSAGLSSQSATYEYYPVWEEKHYVFFMDNNPAGARVAVTKEGVEGDSISAYEVTFALKSTESITGWYRDEALTDGPVDSVTLATANIFLYPKVETGHYIKYVTGKDANLLKSTFVAADAVATPQYSGSDVQRPGYTFARWSTEEDGPAYDPAVISNDEDLTLYAVWNANADMKYTIAYWTENADDDGYSFIKSETAEGSTGKAVNLTAAQKNPDKINDATHFTYNADKTDAELSSIRIKGDGSTIVNVYFTRNRYTLTFKGNAYQCGKQAHTHSHDSVSGYGGNRKYYGGCYPENGGKTPICGLAEHTHSYAECGREQRTETITAKYNAEISAYFKESRLQPSLYGGIAWEEAAHSVFTKPLQTLDRMPGKDLTFAPYGSLGTRSQKTMYYYVEKVENAEEISSWPTRNPDSTHYELYKTVTTYFNYATYDEEYHEIEGFTRFSMKDAGFNTTSFRKDFSNGSLYLYYKRNSYDLIYRNLGEIAQTLSVKYDKSLNRMFEYQPTAPSSLSGYEFKGWYTSEDCLDGTEADTQLLKMPAANTTVYAKWVPPVYEATYHLTMAGGAEPAGSMEISRGEKIKASMLPNVVDSEGNVLFTGDETLEQVVLPADVNWAGWAVKSGDTYTLYNFDSLMTEDVTLYPYYIDSAKYEIVYDTTTNKGSGTVTDLKRYADGADADIQYAEGVTPPDGKVFIYWNTKPDDSGDKYLANQKIKISVSKFDENKQLKLYAIYGDQSATTSLTYHSNYPAATGLSEVTFDQIGANNTSVLMNNESFALSGLGSIPAINGYTFVGWNSKADGTGTKYEPETVVGADNLSENHLYAEWSIINYTITYEDGVNGTVFTAKEIPNQHYGDATPAFGTKDPERAGYSFDGWKPEVAETVTDNATYTAQWKANTDTAYKVEFYYQSEGAYPATATSLEDRTGTTDTLVNVTDADKIPTQDGYVFDENAANILEGNIEGDGSLVLKVFFKQQFTVKYQPGDHGTFSEQSTGSLDYNATTPAAPKTTGEPGYTFTGWSPQLSAKVTADATYVAQWSANADTAYKVEFYYQSEGAYPATATSSDDRTGTTDTTANVTDTDKTPTRDGYVFDSAAENVLSGNIAGDGSLVLKVFFKQQFTVKYQPGDHGTFTEQSTGSLDYNAATPAAPETTGDAGYTFTGWSPQLSAKVTADATYVAQWSANTDTAYKVEFYYQSNGEYPATATSSDDRTGTTDTTANVRDTDKTPTRDGYVFDSAAENVLSGNIAGDGSLVLKVFFKQQFTVKYQPGDHGTFTEQSTGSLDYNAATPAAPETTGEAGYTFTGWSPTVDANVIKDATYVAQWIADEDTAYTVEFYYQTEGQYSATADSSVGRGGETATTANVTAEDKIPSQTGYVFDDSESAGNVLSGTITGDGKLVLKVHFKQQFTVEYQPGDHGTFSEQSTGSLDYNAATPAAPETTGEAGYTFTGWEPSREETVTEDATYVAQWEADDDTAYKVEFYYQDEGVYPTTATSSDDRTGTTDTTANVTDTDKTPTRDGYVFDSAAENVLSGNIEGDGSLALKVFFKQQFTVKYLPGDHGTFEAQSTAELDYGTATPAAPTVTGEAGYTFDKWDTVPAATVTRDAEYTAIWKANEDTAYTVEFYYQADGEYPDTPTNTITRSGTTDTLASVSDEEKTPIAEWYVFDENAENVLEGNIEGDGSLVLKVYFKQQFTVNYLPGDHGTFEAQSTGSLDYNAPTPAAPETSGEAGYTFVGWNPEQAETVTEDKTYTAQWSANTDTAYLVEFYYQDEGIYPTTATSSDDRTGTTDTTANVTDTDKTPTRDGYVFDSAAENVLSGNIEGDGSLVLKVFFKQQFTVKYLPGDHGTFEAQSTAELDYGTATPAAPETTGEAGYTFDKWDTVPAATVTRDAEYTAIWKANEDTAYTVEFYYQDEGVYPTTATSSDDRTGTTDTLAEVTEDDQSPTKEGYVFDADAENVLEGNIEGDGSLVLKVYFKQQFTVNYLPGDHGTFEAQSTESIDYGTATPAAPAVTGDAGYVFDGWDVTPTETVTADATYTAQWHPYENTSYRIELYYQQNGEYPESASSTWTLAGTTDTTAIVTSEYKTPTREGYAFDEAADNVLSGNIAGDNSLVLKVYFKQQFTVTFEPGDHGAFTAVTTDELDYGSDTPAAPEPSGEYGYMFTVWSPDIAGIVTENATYTAQWTVDPDITKDLHADVDYSFDGEIDPDQHIDLDETVQVLEPDELSTDGVEEKEIPGYKLEEITVNGEPVEEIPDTVPDGSSVEFHYVIDEEQTKDLHADVDYSFDGEIDPDQHIDLDETVQVLDPDEVSTDGAEIKDIPGYTLDEITVNGEPVDEIPEKVPDGSVIEFHYIIDETQTKDLLATVDYQLGDAIQTADHIDLAVTVQVLQPDTLSTEGIAAKTYDGWTLSSMTLNGAVIETLPATVNNGDAIVYIYTANPPIVPETDDDPPDVVPPTPPIPDRVVPPVRPVVPETVEEVEPEPVVEPEPTPKPEVTPVPEVKTPTGKPEGIHKENGLTWLMTMLMLLSLMYFTHDQKKWQKKFEEAEKKYVELTGHLPNMAEKEDE